MNQSHKVSILLIGAVIGIVMGGATGVGVATPRPTSLVAYGPAYPLPVPAPKVRYAPASNVNVYDGASRCEIVGVSVSCNNGYSGKY